MPPPGQAEDLQRRDRHLARLDHPEAAGQPGREVERDGAAVRPPGGQRGRQGRRVVRHQQVARLQEAGQVVEAGVGETVVAVVADQQPDLVAPEAARLGRLVRLQLGRQGEGQQPAWWFRLWA